MSDLTVDLEKEGVENPSEVSAEEKADFKSTDATANREFYGDSLTDSYRLKSELVGECLSQIGMGRYQWELFVVAGLSWITDNFWSQGLDSVQPAIRLEFSDVSAVSYSSVAYYVGLILGAFCWGISADLTGRKLAFNATVLIGGTFACAVAGTRNFVAFSALWAIIGSSTGGNLPVVSMLFLESIPYSKQWLLTALSAWWNLGQLVVSLIAWVFVANFVCPSDETYLTCQMRDNMGWRYLMITLGGLALAFVFIRILIFPMPESPRFLLSKGRDSEAVNAINYIARRNGKPEPLSLAMLQEIDVKLGTAVLSQDGIAEKSKSQLLKDSLASFQGVKYMQLFATRKLAWHTSLIWFIWLTIGVAYPLYFNFLPSYIARKSSESLSLNVTYRNYCIVSACGVFGPLLAAYAVNTRFGRRWMMGFSAILSGIFLFAYTAIDTSVGNLAFSCVTSLLGNFFYAVMYAFTPESFPAPHRGTATGTAATLLGLGGLTASLVSANSGFTALPIYVSAALWVVVGLASFALPFETHGRAAI